jgi:hypothetical protein
MPLPDNLSVNGYLPPPLRCVNNGETAHGTAHISLPLTTSYLNCRDDIEIYRVHLPDRLQVILSIGYGFGQFVPDLESAGIRGDFQSWQQIVESNVATIGFA